MTDAVIQVSGLKKAYGEVQALAGVDLTIASGEVFALLGPNGAGKTTAVEVLEGFVDRDEGEVRVLGYDPADGALELRRQVGIVSQETAVDPFLSVAEMVEMMAGTYPDPRPIDEVIDQVGLMAKRDVRVKKLSGGQKRRLDVALALVGRPKLLFLDEPTTGFDPDARREAWAMIRELRSLGTTIVLTTHYMEEAQELADRVAVLVEGRIVADGSPDTLGGRADAATTIRLRLAVDVGPLPEPFAGAGTRRADGVVELEVDDPVPALHALTGWALERAVDVRDLSVARPTLEQTYLRLIGHEHASDRKVRA